MMENDMARGGSVESSTTFYVCRHKEPGAKENLSWKLFEEWDGPTLWCLRTERENWSYPGVASRLASREATQGSGRPPGNPTQGQ